MSPPVRFPLLVALVLLGAIVLAVGSPEDMDGPVDAATANTFTGYIVDTDGEGIPDVSVTIDDNDAVTTDVDGMFVAGFTASTDNTITISHEGYSIVTTPFGSGVNGTYDLDLTGFTQVDDDYSMAADDPVIMVMKTVDVTGTISAGSPSYPVPGAKVTVSDGEGQVYTATSTSTGGYSVERVPYRDYTVTVSCVGYEDATGTYDAGASACNIVLTPSTITLTGYACDSDGDPLSGVNVLVNNTMETVSGPDGKFSVSYSKRMYDTVTFGLEGYSIVSGGLDSVLVKSGDYYRIVLDKATRTTDGYTIVASTVDNPLMMKLIVSEYHGRVSSVDGTKSYLLAGATVEFRGNGDTYSCVTDASGYYTMMCPSHDTYTAYVSKVGYQSNTAVVSGNHTDIVLSPADVVIYGKVQQYNENGIISPLSGVSIEVNDEGKGTTDEDGVFEARFVVRESNVLSLHLTGYKINVGGINGVLEGSDGEYIIDLNAAKTDSEGRFVVSSDDYPFIFSRTSTVFSGTVTGTANDTVYPLNGALVVLTSSEGKVLTTYTDEKGRYEVECGYGTYTIRVECNGFLMYGPAEISANQPINDISMQGKDSSLFFGLDLPHSFMILGLLIFGLTALAGLIIWVASKKKIGHITTEMDIEDDTEE